MADVDFFCNYRGCRKPLFSSAWITKCSHIFCEEHGNAIAQNQLCLACNENLLGNLDATYQNLNPPEIFRSMILSGLRPEIIIDIIARAMAFRTYQMAQERAYYDSTIKSLEGQMIKLDSAHKSEITKMQNDILVLNKKQQHLLKELEVQKFKVQEHERILNEKNRQIQIMQMKYESLRCHTTFQHFQNQDTVSQRPNQEAFSQRQFSPMQIERNRSPYMTQENFLQGQNQMFKKSLPNQSRGDGSNNQASDFGVCFKTKPRPSANNSFLKIHKQ